MASKRSEKSFILCNCRSKSQSALIQFESLRLVDTNSSRRLPANLAGNLQFSQIQVEYSISHIIISYSMNTHGTETVILDDLHHAYPAKRTCHSAMTGDGPLDVSAN